MEAMDLRRLELGEEATSKMNLSRHAKRRVEVSDSEPNTFESTSTTRTLLPNYKYRILEGSNWVRVVQLFPSESGSLDEPLKRSVLHSNRNRLHMSTYAHLNYYYAVSYD
jgi:hypothetical protein